MLSARQRHYEDLLDKKELSEMKLQRREAQRLANLQAKELHEQNLRYVRKLVIN
jgi:hypothetical protein